LFEKHKSLWEYASKNYLKFMNIENLTDHGEAHVLNVEKNITNILTDKALEKLSSFDIFCLLSSCTLHDIGMISKKESNESFSDTRKDHHLRVKKLLEENYSQFQFNQQEAKIIGEICFGHGIPNMDEVDMYETWSLAPHGEVNVIFLIALLRIGDLIDLNFLRAPTLVADLKKIKGVSLNHWKLHSKISDVKISHVDKEITIFAQINNQYELSELYNLRNWCEKELNIVKNIFDKNGIFLDRISLHTNLDKKKVLSKENPFLKLASFDWAKHVAFFGRDKEIIDIFEKVLNCKLTVLAGESGVGKTSLLNAGLKQRLIENGFYVFETRVSENFEEGLFKNIKEEFPEIRSKDIIDLLEKISSESLDLIVFIDQFEEIFTLYGQDAAKSKLINFFKNILTNRSISFKVVLSIREDFLAELWEISELVPELYDRKNTYRLKKLNRENAKQTIVNTIQHINYSIENDLVEKLLDDFTQEEETIYPPYIQIVCHEIFKQHKETQKENSEKMALNLAIYDKLGGAKKIISDYFEEILEGFSFEEKVVINEILAPMITYFYTKQRISYEQLVEINANRIDIDKTLNRLIDHRVIKKIETEKNEYELIHDFLAKKILENKPSMGISSRIKRAIEYIELNFDKQILLQEISSKVNLSREHFCRLFKAETKYNFVDYVNEKRIKQAKTILKKDPRIRIIDIYKNVGFANQQHFIKIFKRFTGETPTKFKQRILDEASSR